MLVNVALETIIKPAHGKFENISAKLPFCCSGSKQWTKYSFCPSKNGGLSKG